MKVKINLIRETEYETVVEMDKDRFEVLSFNLNSADNKARREAEKEINNLIKPYDDWMGDNLLRINDFEPEQEEA